MLAGSPRTWSKKKLGKEQYIEGEAVRTGRREQDLDRKRKERKEEGEKRQRKGGREGGRQGSTGMLRRERGSRTRWDQPRCPTGTITTECK